MDNKIKTDTKTTTIGLSQDQREGVAEVLDALLADLNTLYIKPGTSTGT